MIIKNFLKSLIGKLKDDASYKKSVFERITFVQKVVFPSIETERNVKKCSK